MTRNLYRLPLALILSLLLHLAPFVASPPAQEKRPAPPPLQATLRPPPPVAATPPLTLPAPPKPASRESARPRLAAAKPAPAPKAAPPQTWTQAVRQHLKQLQDANQFYPAEAIARGLEGEVLVLMVIDENGSVVATRVEQGSGHPILDDAAQRAVRSLRSLPADAPREALLPVRFRLR